VGGYRNFGTECGGKTISLKPMDYYELMLQCGIWFSYTTFFNIFVWRSC
jgi:hypothetical protein